MKRGYALAAVLWLSLSGAGPVSKIDQADLRAEKDLAAQESMATTSARQAIVAETQAVEMRKQTSFLLWSLFASGAATAISMAAFASTVSTGRRQLRAYVFAEEAMVLDGALAKPVARNTVDWPGVHVQIKNTGQTPAKDVSSWAELLVLPLEAEHMLKPAAITRQSISNIASHASISKTIRSPRKMTDQEKAGVIGGSHAIFLHGWVHYKDTFDRRRSTSFRLKYQGPYPPKGPHHFTYCDEGNDWT